MNFGNIIQKRKKHITLINLYFTVLVAIMYGVKCQNIQISYYGEYIQKVIYRLLIKKERNVQTVKGANMSKKEQPSLFGNLDEFDWWMKEWKDMPEFKMKDLT